MLKDNYEIKQELGEYKDFPYSYKLYLYGRCVWTDDFPEPLTDKQVLENFVQAIQELIEE